MNTRKTIPRPESKFKNTLITGLLKGWSAMVWLLKILIPISLLTFLIEFSGWLTKIDFLLSPLMNLMHLPPNAGLPLAVGLLTGVYGGIASMSTLALSHTEMTIIAVFLLISHNLIQESIIQGKSGFHPVKATISRLLASVVTVMVIYPFLPESESTVTNTTVVGASAAFGPLFLQWCNDILFLSIKICLIIIPLLTLMEFMKNYNIIRFFTLPLTPFLRFLGLNRNVGFLWLTGAFFGLSYGGAAIVEEAKEGNISPAELSRLQISIGINHSLIEDPVLFIPLGIGIFWLWIPRLLAAVIMVNLYNLLRRVYPAKSPKNKHRTNEV
ncbi:MAG: iron transporter [Desulfobacteraceae bacterium]|nr:iron transporter [Desulfobacteraceae bacterium]